MVDAVEQAGVINTVWYNYRRIPAVTLAKQLIDEGRLGKIFHYRANFLQDWTISADFPQGGTGLWRLDAAAPAAASRATCSPTASTRRSGSTARSDGQRDDRDVYQGTQAQPDGKVEPVVSTMPVRSFAGLRTVRSALRIDPLCPRPQGAVHVRSQRREGVAKMGPCKTCTDSSSSTTVTSR